MGGGADGEYSDTDSDASSAHDKEGLRNSSITAILKHRIKRSKQSDYTDQLEERLFAFFKKEDPWSQNFAYSFKWTSPGALVITQNGNMTKDFVETGLSRFG